MGKCILIHVHLLLHSDHGNSCLIPCMELILYAKLMFLSMSSHIIWFLLFYRLIVTGNALMEIYYLTLLKLRHSLVIQKSVLILSYAVSLTDFQVLFAYILSFNIRITKFIEMKFIQSWFR